MTSFLPGVYERPLVVFHLDDGFLLLGRRRRRNGHAGRGGRCGIPKVDCAIPMDPLGHAQGQRGVPAIVLLTHQLLEDRSLRQGYI